jgi:hypothetical protein
MNEVDLTELSEVKSRDRIRQVAEGISPGKGINIHEVAAELGLGANSVRTQAQALGCYSVISIKGKQTGFLTSLQP